MASLDYELNNRKIHLELKTDAECCIGRDPDCAVFLGKIPEISRRHCVIYFNAAVNAFALSDLYSSSGTFLNGRKIGNMEIPLHDGDTITVGPVVLTFSGENAAAEKNNPGKVTMIHRAKAYMDPNGKSRQGKYRYQVNAYFQNGEKIQEQLDSNHTAELYLTASPKGEVHFLKILKELPQDPAAGRELKKCAKALPELTGLLPVLDAGSLEDGACFLITPWLEFASYAKMISMLAPMPQTQALALIYSIIMILERGSQNGIFHGALRPSGIFYAPQAGNYIAGMGLSAWREKFFPELVKRPAQWYAAPETTAGKSVWQSDQYALGIMLFQLLTGILPFRADDPKELAALHREHTMPLPQERNPLVRTIPAVNAVIVRMTMKDPSERYDSWKTLLSDMEKANSILKKHQNLSA